MPTLADLPLIGFLVFLEGILSIDNAVVLAVMVKHLPPLEQKRALTYGLVGAAVFRLICLAFATQLMNMHWVKIVGGVYLCYVAIKHFWQFWSSQNDKDSQPKTKSMSFWRTVVLVEVMDIAFAVDSILAAVAVSKKLSIVFIGGMTGVILIRYAASGFIKLLKVFPKFESAAFWMILVIGLKITSEGLELPIDFEHIQSPGFIIFWSLMSVCLLTGFRRP